jgi:hypothetical protein
MLAAIALATIVAQPCLKPHKGQPIRPIQSCVIARPTIEVMGVPDEAIDPIAIVAVKYVLIDTPAPLCGWHHASTGGGWTGFTGNHVRAPEIDPGSAMSALSLLFGSLIVIRSRKS